MQDYEVGVNAPPFHCNCRCTTVPYFYDEFTEDEKRASRDEDGKTVLIDGKIKYEEWKKEFVSDNTYKLPDSEKFKNDNKKSLKVSYYDNIIKQTINSSNTTEELKNIVNNHIQGNYIKIDIECESPFLYNDTDRLLYINPEHKLFNEYDLTKSLLHELGHKIDKVELSVLSNPDFSQKVQEQIKEFNSNIDLKNKYIRLFNEDDNIYYNMYISDIVSALTKNEVRGAYAHSNDYWRKMGNKESEIFANIFSVICCNDEETINLLKLDFPIIYTTVMKILNL